jgi:hypothetical protein
MLYEPRPLLVRFKRQVASSASRRGWSIDGHREACQKRSREGRRRALRSGDRLGGGTALAFPSRLPGPVHDDDQGARGAREPPPACGDPRSRFPSFRHAATLALAPTLLAACIALNDPLVAPRGASVSP